MIYEVLNSFRTIRNEHFKIKDSWFSVDGLLMDFFSTNDCIEISV